MEIRDVKVWFSQFGITTPSMPKRKVCYMPMAKITYTDKKIKAKQISLLDCGVIGGFSSCTLTKKNYLGTACGETFFCVISKMQILVFDAEGNFKSNLNTEETGLIISVAEDSLFCLKNGKTLSGYTKDGALIGKREFTEEESREFSAEVEASIKFENSLT